MRQLRRLIVMVVSSVAALLLIGPASAFADRPLPAPPWDDDPTHWEKVIVSDCWSDSTLPEAYNPDVNGDPQGQPCSFTGLVGDLLTRNPAGQQVVACRVTLDVDVWANGETRITAVQLAGGTVNPQLCPSIQINNLPWDDQICERIEDAAGPLTDHEYWDALEIDFTLGGNTVAGVGYVQLRDSTGMTGSGSNPLAVDSTFAINTEVFGSGGYDLSDPNGALFNEDMGLPNYAFTVESVENQACEAETDGTEGWDFP